MTLDSHISSANTSFQTPSVVRLVDDDPGVLSSESFVLAIDGWKTRSYLSAEAFLAEDDLSRPGCIVLDVRMPGISGLELQILLKERNCTLPILFLSGHGDLDMAVMALKRGAADFLQKPIIPEKLQFAVRRLVRWHERLCRSLEEQKIVLRALAQLTPRELEVARLASKGLLSKEIATALGSSEATVKQQRSNVMQKLDVRNAVELLELLQQADEPVAERFPIEELESSSSLG